MPRPQIIVNVTAALARRGAPTATGTAFFAFAGATGPTSPVRCLTSADATAAGVPSGVASWVGYCLSEGAPEVVVVRAAAVDVNAVTEAEWTTALGLFTDEFGAGQVMIPGVATAGAYAALLAHSDATGRTVLLDAESDATAATAAAAASGLAAGAGAERAGLIAPWVQMPGPAGVAVEVPGSVIAAALAARGDAVVGHANHAPAGDQGRGAGIVNRGINVTATYTAAELDTLHDAGVSVIRQMYGKPTLYGWRSVSSDDRFRQLNAGRFSMQLGTGIFAAAEQFLFRNIDGRGHLFAELEGALRGYLMPLYAADALYGATADDAFDVAVADVNTPDTIAAGELRSSVEVALTPHTEKVVIDVVTSIAEGA